MMVKSTLRIIFVNILKPSDKLRNPDLVRSNSEIMCLPKTDDGIQCPPDLVYLFFDLQFFKAKILNEEE